MDDITIDLGAIPLDMARTLLIAVLQALNGMSIWDRENVSHLTALRALLTYRIAKAEKVAPVRDVELEDVL